MLLVSCCDLYYYTRCCIYTRISRRSNTDKLHPLCGQFYNNTDIGINTEGEDGFNYSCRTVSLFPVSSSASVRVDTVRATIAAHLLVVSVNALFDHVDNTW